MTSSEELGAALEFDVEMREAGFLSSLWQYFFGSESLSKTALSGLTIVCISDTHGQHQLLQMPPGDILICAGDYTLFGNRDDAVDFNSWLGELSYKHIIVVQGNHETNSEWKNEVAQILSNATLLRNEVVEVDGIRIFGTEFFWPCPSGNPNFDLIDDRVDIVVAHAPAYGYVDNGQGCRSLTKHMARARPRLVVSGHIHAARGIEAGKSSSLANTVFVNAATAGKHHKLLKQPIIIRF